VAYESRFEGSRTIARLRKKQNKCRLVAPSAVINRRYKGTVDFWVANG
jgi:hypothetical protein